MKTILFRWLIYLKKNDFINLNIKKHSEIDINLNHLKDALKKQFKVLDGIVKITDSSFLGAVNAQKKKQFNGIDKLEKRLLKAQKRKMSSIENDLIHIYEEILINNYISSFHVCLSLSLFLLSFLSLLSYPRLLLVLAIPI